MPPKIVPENKNAVIIVINYIDGEQFNQMHICHMHKGDGRIRFGIYACSPEESSFKAVFSSMNITECQWLAHDGQQPDE